MGILRNPSQNLSVRPIRSTDSDITTSGESIIFVDTTNNPVTVTLSSGDTEIGRQVTIVDSGGNSSNNNITVDTEGSETINGGASLTIDTDYGAKAIGSDGDNWFTTGAGGGGGGIFSDIDGDGVVELPAIYNGLQLEDGQELQLSTDGSVHIRYDAGESKFKIGGDSSLQDASDTTDLLELDRGSGDLAIEGVLTEGATL